MLSLRTALFRSLPLNGPTRQTVRLLHLPHGMSSYKPPTTIMGRAFSMAPKLPSNHTCKDLIDYDDQNAYMLLDMWSAGLSARQVAKKGFQEWKQMSDGELRMRLESHVRGNKEKLKNIKMMDDEELRSDLEKALRVWAQYLPDLMMNEVGEEYGAILAGRVYESKTTEAEIDAFIEEEEKKVEKENKDK